jgi:hypothetical protein
VHISMSKPPQAMRPSESSERMNARHLEDRCLHALVSSGVGCMRCPHALLSSGVGRMSEGECDICELGKSGGEPKHSVS